MRIAVKILLIPVIVMGMVSCLKDDDYSTIPELEFLSFTTFSANGQDIDSAVFYFTFTDGDGDLGSDDTANVNCFLNYYEKDADTMRLYSEFEREYRLPSLTPNAKNKAIEGEISLTLKPAPVFNPLNDSVYQWKCHVVDRSGNESEPIFTEVLKK